MATYMQNVIWVSTSRSTRILQRYVRARTCYECHYREFCDSGPDKPNETHLVNSADIPRFNHPDVQTILTRITGLDLQKIFRPSREHLRQPSYKLVSEKKLKEAQDDAIKRAQSRLEMPPVVEERKPIQKVLSENPELKGLETSKLVFTDITYGLRDRDRLISVREPCGKLRLATWDERDRITQVYLPRERREMTPPTLFEDQQLPNALSQDRHEMVLDAACTQFEPDAADFIRVHHRVYDDLYRTGKYDLLRSTRHFGGMSYYLVRQRRIDGLLVDMIQRNLITDAEDLLVLFHMMHPTCKSALETKEKQLRGLDIIKAYIQSEAGQSGKLELVLQAYENEHAESTASSDQATGS